MPIKQEIKKRVIKKNSKKAKKKLTPNHSGVLLEEMNSNMKLILEDHTGLDKKIEGLDKKIDTKIDGLQGEMNLKFDGLRGEMNSKFNEVNSNFKTVFEYLSKIDDELQDIQIIKSDIKETKQEHSNKSDLEYVKKMEQRMNKIEMNYIELRAMVKERK